MTQSPEDASIAALIIPTIIMGTVGAGLTVLGILLLEFIPKVIQKSFNIFNENKENEISINSKIEGNILYSYLNIKF